MNFITYIVRGSFPFFEQLFVKRRRLVLFVLMPLVSLLFHIAIFGTDLVGIHVWRQTQTMGTITNFYEAFGRWDFNIFTPHINDYGISQDGRGLYCMEFPLMQYVVAWFYFILRVPITEVWLVRVLMFGVGLGTVFGIEALMRHIFRIDRSLPLVAAWMLLFSPVFYYYMLNPMPDNVALGFSIWGLAIFFKVYEYDHQSTSTELRRYLECLLGSLLLALAALVKLPYVLFTVPVVILIIDDFLYQYAARWRSVAVLLMLFGCLVSPAWWYMSVVGHWQGNGVVLGILDSRLTAWQWLDIFAFHWYSTQFELLLNYAATPFYLFGIASLFIPVLRRRLFAYYRGEAIAVIGLAVAWISYLAFEANMIGRTHDYYLMPFLPHLLIVATMGLYRLKMVSAAFKNQNAFHALRFGAVVLTIALPFTAYLRIQQRWNTDNPDTIGFTRDLYVFKHDLQNAVPDTALCIVGNDDSHHIWFYYLHKKGWAVEHSDVDAREIRNYVAQGAKYLYSDARTLDTRPDIAPLLDTLLLERGKIRVFRLKPDPALHQ